VQQAEGNNIRCGQTDRIALRDFRTNFRYINAKKYMFCVYVGGEGARGRERRKWRDDFVNYNIVISGEHIRLHFIYS